MEISPTIYHCPDGSEMLIRPISHADSLTELTELLHRAYKRLADMGLRFVATYQNEEETKKRITDAHCLVGILKERIAATIVLYEGDARHSSPCEWYRQEGIWTFGQFAVEPALQRQGIGGALIERIEEIAHTAGAKELALDTSDQATHLIAYYGGLGYREVGYVQWDVTNYRSIVMSKSLVNT